MLLLPLLAFISSSVAGNTAPACSWMNTYPREGLLAFEGGGEMPLCTEHWQSKNFTRPALNTCLGRSPSSSSLVIEMRRHLNTDTGLPPKKIAEIRKDAVLQCCAQDLDCMRAMNQVSIETCKPPTRPSEPNLCNEGPFYHVPPSELDGMWKALNSRSKSTTLPISGKIFLTQKKANQEDSTPTDLFHEFFHACDFIRNQLQVMNGEKDDSATHASLWRLKQEYQARNYCNDTPELRQSIEKLWLDLGESKGLADCLVKVLEVSAEEGNLNSCPNLCRGRYLTESFAMANEFIGLSLTRMPSTYPVSGCLTMQNNEHPLGVNVLECVAQHSKRFRDQFRKVNQCN